MKPNCCGTTRRALLCGVVAVIVCAAAPATLARQADASPAAQAVEFRFERPGIQVPAYSIVLGANGEGTYTESPSQPPLAPPEARGPAELSRPPGVTPIRVGPATLAKLLAGRSSLGSRPCETRQKNIANTGRKTLVYRGDGAAASCTFNYSESTALNEVASTFIALAETLHAGTRLAAKHRFDRLGLDPEMEILDNEVRAGRALEVGNISPVLRSIAEDDRVIERVRRRAARLLQDSGTLPAEAEEKAPPAPSDL